MPPPSPSVIIIDPNGNSEMIIMEPSEPKVATYTSIFPDLRRGAAAVVGFCVCCETNRGAAGVLRQEGRGWRVRGGHCHMIIMSPPPPSGATELTKCIFLRRRRLIDLLILNNIHIHSIHLPPSLTAPPTLHRSAGCPFATSISPSVTPAKQNESVYCGGGLTLTPLRSR